MAYDYIKRTYPTAPKIGVRVRHKETNRKGFIRPEDRSASHYVQVQFDGDSHALPCHPMAMEYPIRNHHECNATFATPDRKNTMTREGNDQAQRVAGVVKRYFDPPGNRTITLSATDALLLANATLTTPPVDAVRLALEVRPLDWQEVMEDRGDGLKEVRGWEADNGFDSWYVVEQYFGSDSFGFQVNFDHVKIGDCDDPDAAKAIAQADFARRITTALSAPLPTSSGGMDSTTLPAVDTESQRLSSENKAPAPHWQRRWPHDQPNGWNLDSAGFLALVQANPLMWLALGRAKYLELRVDTRDGGFNLYDRDSKPLNPDEVIDAINKVRADFGDGALQNLAAAPKASDAPSELNYPISPSPVRAEREEAVKILFERLDLSPDTKMELLERNNLHAVADAILSLSPSKNQQGAEPVAWRWRIKNGAGETSGWELSAQNPQIGDYVLHDCEPLYAAPPQVTANVSSASQCGEGERS